MWFAVMIGARRRKTGSSLYKALGRCVAWEQKKERARGVTKLFFTTVDWLRGPSGNVIDGILSWIFIIASIVIALIVVDYQRLQVRDFVCKHWLVTVIIVLILVIPLIIRYSFKLWFQSQYETE